MTTYVLATANPDKADEIKAVLSDFDLMPRPADVPEVAETGSTLEENARLKAVALVEATGMPAIADDTGLEVDALDGAPGIDAAIYAGEPADYERNRTKLLAELSSVGEEQRTARFRTVAIMRRPDGSELVAHGVVEGTIATEARGGGWGYDPVFAPTEGDGLHFAEMAPDEKHAISHRGRAFRELARLIGTDD